MPSKISQTDEFKSPQNLVDSERLLACVCVKQMQATDPGRGETRSHLPHCLQLLFECWEYGVNERAKLRHGGRIQKRPWDTEGFHVLETS